jgi:hypothetical protein
MKILIVFSQYKEAHKLQNVLLQDYQEDHELNRKDYQAHYLEIGHCSLVSPSEVELGVENG